MSIKKLKLLIIVSLTIFFSLDNTAILAKNTTIKNLKQSRQLIVVLAPNWNSATGQLFRYQRNTNTQDWQPIGKPIAVVVGKNGLAWGVNQPQSGGNRLLKKEGDLRTPAGLFKLGPEFGFARLSKNKLNYLYLTKDTVCVDDINSRYYNKIIASSKLKKIDWRDGEQMRDTSLYQHGLVIRYNTNPIDKSAGSCIFMHIWRNQNKGTAGCIAMQQDNLIKILNWLDPKKQPLIAIFPSPTYVDLQKKLK